MTKARACARMAGMEGEMLKWLLRVLFDTDAGPQIDPDG